MRTTPAARADRLVVELTLTCLTPGTYDLVLRGGQTSTTITIAADARWSLTTAYSKHEVTPFGVNANGDAYGAAGDRGTPDLIATIATIATNGREGYAYSDDLDGPTPSSPAKAKTWNEAHAGRTRTIPVYTSDGRTVIGEFRVNE